MRESVRARMRAAYQQLARTDAPNAYEKRREEEEDGVDKDHKPLVAPSVHVDGEEVQEILVASAIHRVDGALQVRCALAREVEGEWRVDELAVDARGSNIPKSISTFSDVQHLFSAGTMKAL